MLKTVIPDMDLERARVELVLGAFRSMGASDEDLDSERARLTSDEEYLAEWYSVTQHFGELDVVHSTR